MQWRMIDALGPFFKDDDGSRLNWSKVPFASLEENGTVVPSLRKRITQDFMRFADRVAEQGFNAVTLDDVAHLTLIPDYDPALRSKLECYREWYAELFACAVSCGLTPFVTTDVMFYNKTLRRRLGRSVPKVSAFFAETLEALFRDFPTVGGVITRIGETDAPDVKGDFRSELVIRRPADARRFLREVLPVCERFERTLIFRTWSVGAYAIGDLMWNRSTCERTFAGLHSTSLVVSHKCGESDFFRYLPLNKQFFRGDYRKMIELQARREYEGCGEFPSFIGWDHEQYALALRGRNDLAGFCVWCQTGGWTSFSRRAFLDPAGIWNELNTAVTLDVFHHQFTVEEAVTRFCRARWPRIPPEQMLTFLRLSDEVIKEVLYVDEFAQRKLFFRRLRVPPLLWVFWDHILINHSMRKLFRCFVGDGDAKVLQARLGLMKIREMQAMATEWNLRPDDLVFMYDTFEILAAARAYFFQPFSEAMVARLKHLARRYRKRHRVRYTILLNFTPVQTTRRTFKRMLTVALRGERGYRFIDQIITIRLLSFAYPLIRRFSRNRLTDFADRQAMGIDVLFR